MCIMEVRPGQRNITIAQACAHNANTILGDLEMFQLVAQARKDDAALRAIEQMAQHTRVAYAAMLGYFGEQLAADVQDENGHWDNPAPHEHEHGNERTFSRREQEKKMNAVTVERDGRTYMSVRHLLRLPSLEGYTQASGRRPSFGRVRGGLDAKIADMDEGRRGYTPEYLCDLARAIEDGSVDPVLIDTLLGRPCVLNGHHRIALAGLIGTRYLPVTTDISASGADYREQKAERG